MSDGRYRIARVRPREAAGLEYFAVNSAQDFTSPQGRIWTLTPSPFPQSPANAGSPFTGPWQPGAHLEEADLVFLAPCRPANVLGMAHNTGAAGREQPRQAFHKAATSVIGPGEAIELAPGVGRVEPEAELTAVVGTRSKNLTLENAQAALLGFTIGNDVSARDLQSSDELWISAKSQDTFTPLGPWIVAGSAPGAFDNVTVGLVHNGEELASASTADLGWSVSEILVYLTSFMTLHPGDVVLTGFPAECRPLETGDTIGCRVGGIGELANPVTGPR